MTAFFPRGALGAAVACGQRAGFRMSVTDGWNTAKTAADLCLSRTQFYPARHGAARLVKREIERLRKEPEQEREDRLVCEWRMRGLDDAETNHLRHVLLVMRRDRGAGRLHVLMDEALLVRVMDGRPSDSGGLVASKKTGRSLTPRPAWNSGEFYFVTLSTPLMRRQCPGKVQI